MQRHKEVVAAFSPGSGQAGSLAICTQVAEISLDISATLLVTELAPVPALNSTVRKVESSCDASESTASDHAVYR